MAYTIRFPEEVEAMFRLMRERAEELRRQTDWFPEFGPLTRVRHAKWANRVLRNCNLDNPKDCWEWQGATGKNGYGRVKIDGKLYLPHRVVALAARIVPTLHVGADDEHVLHTCDNGRCCNWKHLKRGTKSDNMRDCARKGRLRGQKMRQPPIP